MPVSIDPSANEVPDNPLPIDTSVAVANAPVSPDIASSRAFKARYGMTGVPNASYEEIFQKISQGKENESRQDYASRIDMQKSQVKQQVINNYISDPKNPPLDRNSYQQLTGQLGGLDQPTDPKTVFEEYFSKEAISKNIRRSLEANLDKSDIAEGMKVMPVTSSAILDQADIFTAKNEFLLKKAQDITTAQDEQGMIGKVLDVLKSIDPTYDRRKFGALLAPRGLADELERQATEDHRLPLPQFMERVDERLSVLAKDNPGLALVYLSHLTGQSSSQVALGNFFDLLNLSTIPGLANVAGNVAKGILAREAAGFAKVAAGKTTAEEFTQTLKQVATDVVQATTGPDVSRATLTAATGDVSEAVVQKGAVELLKDIKGLSSSEKKAVDALPSFLKLDWENIKNNPGRLTRDTLNKIQDSYFSLANNITETLLNRIQVERIPGFLASEQAIRELKDAIKDQLPGIRNAILDISNPVQNRITTAYELEVTIGKPNNGGLWFRKNELQNYAKWQGLTDYEIRPQGVGYTIVITKPVPEIAPAVRENLIRTGITDSTNSFLKNWVNRFSTPENVASPADRMNRKVVTVGSSNLIALAQQDAVEIGKLMRGTRFRVTEAIDANGNIVNVSKKNLWEDWERVVKASRDVPDPKTGLPGWTFDNPVQLDTFYQQHIGRLPVEAETQAYFAYKRFLELDRILRNNSVLKYKLRLGTESHSIPYRDTEGKLGISPQFDGVLRGNVPGGESTIAIVDETGNTVIHRTNDPAFTNLRRDTKNKAGDVTKKGLDSQVEEGRLKVVEVYSPEQRPLAGFGRIGDEHVRYVLAPRLDSKSISFEQVPRRGGGHFDYDYDLWIKQAIVRPENVNNNFRHIYEGDKTAFAVSIRALGEDAAGVLNNIGQHLKNGRKDEAKALSEARMPVSWDELRDKFYPSKSPDGKILPPQFNWDEPFRVIRSNETISKVDNTLANRYEGTFHDATRSGSLNKQYQVQYTGERDAINVQALRDIGTRDKPVFDLQPASMIDPIPSMHRALSRITQSTYMDDYKLFAVEHWVQEAKKFLDLTGSRTNMDKYAPYALFHDPKFLTNAPPDQVQRLLTMKRNTDRLVGTPSDLDAFLHQLSQRISDSTYNSFGPRVSTTIDPEWVLGKLQDPARVIRAITFKTTLGLFNPATLFTQLQTHTNIAAIAGIDKAAQGGATSLMYAWTKINRTPEMITYLDKAAGKFGFKPGEFTEAMQGLENSGFGKVGSEYQNIDNAFRPSLVKGVAGQVFDAGDIAFKMGEGNVRHAAWFVAYKEFRDLHPNGNVTNRDWLGILDRADLLNNNMTRASGSVLNSGPLSVTTQFLTYQLRLAELFWSKRIGETLAERTAVRARLLAANALMYGAPMAAGVSALPVSDWLRQKATEEAGYVPQSGVALPSSIQNNSYAQSVNKHLSTFFMEGLPAYMHAVVSGGFDLQKGTLLNYGEKWGSQGYTTIKDVLKGDKPWWTIAFGAAGSKMANAWEGFSPILTVGMSYFRDENRYYPFDPNDFLQVVKEINTLNTVHKSIVAFNTSRVFAKKGQLQVEGITPWAAAYMGITGLQPQDTADLQTFYGSNKDQENANKEAEKWFLKEYRRAIFSTDRDEFHRAMTRATNGLNIMGYPEEKWAGLYARGEEENKAQVDRIPWDWAYKKPVPSAKQDMREDVYRRMQQVKDNK